LDLINRKCKKIQGDYN